MHDNKKNLNYVPYSTYKNYDAIFHINSLLKTTLFKLNAQLYYTFCV